jgi:hypothetical protein
MILLLVSPNQQQKVLLVWGTSMSLSPHVRAGSRRRVLWTGRVHNKSSNFGACVLATGQVCRLATAVVHVCTVDSNLWYLTPSNAVASGLSCRSLIHLKSIHIRIGGQARNASRREPLHRERFPQVSTC